MDMSNTEKRYTKNGYEVDLVSKYRHDFVYLGRAGVTKSIKRDLHQRERSDYKKQIRDEYSSYLEELDDPELDI